jgi:hypothetical protein
MALPPFETSCLSVSRLIYSDELGMTSMAEPPRSDADKMCDRVMWLLVHEISPAVRPQIKEWDKDAVWREASSTLGIYQEFGPHLKDTVFRMLVDRRHIEDLGTRIRMTPQGARIPVNRGLYDYNRSYLNP